MDEGEKLLSINYIKYNNKLSYSIIIILIITLLIQIIIFTFLIPKELSIFKNKLEEIDNFEKKVNIMERKFDEIYNIVMNFCDLYILKKVCYANITYTNNL